MFISSLVKVISDKSAPTLSISNINIRLHGHRRNSRCVLQYILQFPMEINYKTAKRSLITMHAPEISYLSKFVLLNAWLLRLKRIKLYSFALSNHTNQTVICKHFFLLFFFSLWITVLVQEWPTFCYMYIHIHTCVRFSVYMETAHALATDLEIEHLHVNI